MPQSEPYRVCFVCSGNICRSPMADVVMRRLLADAGLADRVVVDSAGTGGWHAGGGADERSVETLAVRGYDGSAHRARQWLAADFADRDLILAMDRGHLRELRSLAPDEDERAKVRLFLSYVPDQPEQDVPDPYYGGPDGFEHVLDLVEAGCRAILAEIEVSV